MREKIFCIYGCFNASRYRCQRRQRLYTSLDTIEFLDTCVCIKTHIDKVLLYKWLTAPFLSFMKPSEFGKKTDIKNAITYENYDGKTQTTMAKICRYVLGLQQQNLIGLLAKLACVLLLRSKKDV